MLSFGTSNSCLLDFFVSQVEPDTSAAQPSSGETINGANIFLDDEGQLCKALDVNRRRKFLKRIALGIYYLKVLCTLQMHKCLFYVSGLRLILILAFNFGRKFSQTFDNPF